jgi:hypothetical protein
MGWTIIIENENGQAIKRLPDEFILSDHINISRGFKILKYLDPYGDTTFNSMMIEDLLNDLSLIKKSIDNKESDQIDKVIELALMCKNDVHTYLKFYGD